MRSGKRWRRSLEHSLRRQPGNQSIKAICPIQCLIVVLVLMDCVTMACLVLIEPCDRAYREALRIDPGHLSTLAKYAALAAGKLDQPPVSSNSDAP